MEQTSGLPVLTVEVDRAKAARYGLNMADVQDTVAIAIGGRDAGILYRGDRRFNIGVRLPEGIRADVEALRRLPILLPKAGEAAAGLPRASYIPLGELATLELAPGPNRVSRENGKRRIVISANVRGRDVGGFVAQAMAALDQQVKVPTGYWITWAAPSSNCSPPPPACRWWYRSRCCWSCCCCSACSATSRTACWSSPASPSP